MRRKGTDLRYVRLSRITAGPSEGRKEGSGRRMDEVYGVENPTCLDSYYLLLAQNASYLVCLDLSLCFHHQSQCNRLQASRPHFLIQAGYSVLGPSGRVESVLSSWLRSEAKSGRGSTAEDNELRFEEDITVDGESDAGVTLDTAEAGAARHRGILDVAARHDGPVGSDPEGDAGEGCRAGEDVATLRGVVASTGDFSVVGADGAGWKVE